jgi:hypothetical protein
LLESRRLKNGAWSYGASGQPAFEPTCFAYLALRSETEYSELPPEPLLKRQSPDGSWLAFDGDNEPSCTSALAIGALTPHDDAEGARSKAVA